MTKDFIREYEKLNDQQKEAVDSIEGPVMVVAGPGTGKTQMLALRIANILFKTDAQPENILCLTFTEAGVKAMKERLVKFIGNSAFNVSISTYHGFANEVINTFPDKFRLKKTGKQIDDLNQLKLIRRIIDNFQERNIKSKLFPYSDKYSKQKDIISAIQTLKKEGYNPTQFRIKAEQMLQNHKDNVELSSRGPSKGKPKAEWLEKLDKLESLLVLADVYQMYQTELADNGYYDFDDSILMVINALKTEESLLAYYQEKYLYIHVDEYQDTNGSQNQIIQLLGNFDKHPNIFVVGDDDQAIYRFQGANLENILFFNTNFDKVKIISTKHNYRSTQNILDSANSLIKFNKNRLENNIENLSKQLTANSSRENQKIKVLHLDNEDAENIFIVKEIKKLVANGVDYKDIAVIYRKNQHASTINELLIKNKIPTKINSGRSLFEQDVIKQMLSVLRLINLNFKELNFNLFNVLNFEFFNIPSIDLFRLSSVAYKNKIAISTLLTDPQYEHLLSNIPTLENIKKIFEYILELNKKSLNVPIERIFELLLNEFNILDFIKTKSIDDILTLNTFYDFIRSRSLLEPGLKLDGFLSDLNILLENNLSITVPTSNYSVNAVNLMTAHSSKGLEFDYVFITKFTESNWGSTRSQGSLLPKDFFTDLDTQEKELALEDERRLFFVALTRAKAQAYITYADQYIQENGSVSVAVPSPFLNEISEDLIDKLSYREIESLKVSIEDLELKLKPLTTINLGDLEKDFLKEQISDLCLSPTALNDYLNSPIEFMYKHLIHIPTIQTKYEVLGSSIHFALESFNRNLTSETRSSLDQVLNEFEKYLKQEFFGNDDYQSTLDEGIRILTNYYNEKLQNNPIRALEIEYNFNYNNVYLKNPSKNDDSIRISGKIDKIELISDDNNLVRVVDYKTGSYKSENALRGFTSSENGEEWRQLLFYALLAREDNLFRPGRNFKNSKYKVIQAKIDFVKELKEQNFTITEEDIKSVEDLIWKVVEKIRNLEFPNKSELLIEFNEFEKIRLQQK